MKLSETVLSCCFTEINAKKIAALCGIGFLYFDLAFLNSIGIAKNDSKHVQHLPALKVTKTKIESNAKKSIKSLEKDWFEKQQNLQEYSKKIFLSSDLLDNKICNALFLRLHSYCQFNESALKNTLNGQTTKFIDTHFKKILQRQDLVLVYGKATVKEMLTQYMTEYTHFEFAAFAFFALQGFTVLLYTDVDDKLRKAMNMTMAFFTKPQTPSEIKNAKIIPILEKHKKMQVVTIAFNKKRSFSEEKTKSVLSAPPICRISSAPDKSYKDKYRFEFDDAELAVIKLVVESNLPREIKSAAISNVLDRKIIKPIEEANMTKFNASSISKSFWNGYQAFFASPGVAATVGVLATIGIAHVTGVDINLSFKRW